MFGLQLKYIFRKTNTNKNNLTVETYLKNVFSILNDIKNL